VIVSLLTQPRHERLKRLTRTLLDQPPQIQPAVDHLHRPIRRLSQHLTRERLQTLTHQADGSALAPREASAAVKLAIAAGNLIHTLPYPEPDQHYGSLARLWPSYDCSGATSFVLYAAGLLGPTALDSTELENYGQPGAGRWITIYANSAHAWIVVAGIALDTADYGGAPIPAGTGLRWRAEALANLDDGTSYGVRHSTGL
jgi:hypothetical protein